jgi:hypothetical protein
MSLSKSKCWYSSNCLYFLKHTVKFKTRLIFAVRCSVEPALEDGNTEANGREPKSCFGRVFNFKLGCFVMCTIAWPI